MYWKLVKSGDLRVQERTPNKFPFVSEKIEEVTGRDEFQHYIHHLDSVVGGYKVAEHYDFHSHCGYDRGPKREALIRAMLTRAGG